MCVQLNYHNHELEQSIKKSHLMSALKKRTTQIKQKNKKNRNKNRGEEEWSKRQRSGEVGKL